ncbi:hypothetical protein [Candidatus Clostridium radicumherbarum]|uniref:hypothetical protein n=1 Tax=Candidatus Clostridium radicumherbarum TaxID=3381662 RepID=UPI003877E634
MISIYILARKDKLKLTYIIIVSIVLLVVYMFIVFTMKTNIDIYKNLGYRMYFESNNILDAMYLILNTLFFFTAIILLSSSVTNKFGMRLALASSLILMLEIVVKSVGFSIFPFISLGDIFWLITVNFSLNRLKKS